MAYVDPDFKTKKALKEALAKGDTVEVFHPNAIVANSIPRDGTITLEGPHYPKPHTWYATGTMKDGKLVRVS